MEGTCIKEKCWLYLLTKEFLGSAPDIECCPFYMETVWTPIPVDGKAEPAKVLKDCVNKRGMLTMLGDIYPRLLGVQQSNEEMRNQTKASVDVFQQIMMAISRRKFSDGEVISIE